MFLWAIAPEFVVAAFGERFAASATIFRIWLLAIPLGIFPMDAALRARNETRHLFRAYVEGPRDRAAGLARGGAVRHRRRRRVVRRGRARREGDARGALPRALADEGIRPSLQALVPWQEISRAAIGGVLASIAGVAVLRAGPRSRLRGRPRPCSTGSRPRPRLRARRRDHLAVLWATGVRPASVLGAPARADRRGLRRPTRGGAVS